MNQRVDSMYETVVRIVEALQDRGGGAAVLRVDHDPETGKPYLAFRTSRVVTELAALKTQLGQPLLEVLDERWGKVCRGVAEVGGGGAITIELRAKPHALRRTEVSAGFKVKVPQPGVSPIQRHQDTEQPGRLLGHDPLQPVLPGIANEARVALRDVATTFDQPLHDVDDDGVVNDG